MMKNNKHFEEPMLEIIKFNSADIIVTSESPIIEKTPTPNTTKMSIIFG